MIQEYQVINKEDIKTIVFPKSEVLADKSEIKERLASLQRGLTLGNIEHGKIKIYFSDENTSYVVDTTIWGITEERVILKQGIVIPINRILKLY